MIALVFSDLHIRRYDSPQMGLVRAAVKEHRPDVVIICGDVNECPNLCVEHYNPFVELDELGVPVVFCLGNHEFAYRTVRDTLNVYRKLQQAAKNTYCLDICGGVTIKGVRFAGNVLWYDGSLCDDGDWDGRIVPSWLDFHIREFNPIDECLMCQRAIQHDLGSTGRRVLVTHCVPDILLNWFSTSCSGSPYNTYSGVRHLLDEVQADYAYCGHTHRPAEAVINGCRCVNVGSNILKHDMRYLIEEIG